MQMGGNIMEFTDRQKLIIRTALKLRIHNFEECRELELKSKGLSSYAISLDGLIEETQELLDQLSEM
jgi:uncharacterized protein Smg (DUF494 family)